MCAASGSARRALTTVGIPGLTSGSSASRDRDAASLSADADADGDGAGADGAGTSATTVSAKQADAAANLEVQWIPGAASSPASGASVVLFDLPGGPGSLPTQLTTVTCAGGCTSTVFRELQFGVTYQATVQPTYADGSGMPAASPLVTLQSSCPADACATVDATAPIGPVDYAGSGLLDSLYPVGSDLSRMEALKTTAWRGSPVVRPDGSWDWSSWDTAEAAGAKTTLVLSNLWHARSPTDPPTPWSDWSAYQAWVTTTVRQVISSGRRVDYWDVYNEPGSSSYYAPANYATVTPALLLEQFLVAYQAIKAVDPGAAIIGPSSSHFSDSPAEYSTPQQPDRDPDMVTFLNFAAAHHLQLAAVSWHELNDTVATRPADNTLLPLDIVDHVAEARRLIAARPALGNPQIFINEYGVPQVQSIPGWDVAYLSALTDAHVNSAVRSCWFDACANPTLTGLLAYDGTSTMPDYWVRSAYASMSGSMLATTSSSDFLSAVGSYNAATASVVALVGRGQNCVPFQPCSGVWPAQSVNITVTVPWAGGSARMTLDDIPNRSTPIDGPATVSDQTVPVTPIAGGKGVVIVTIPAFANDDAYSLELTRSS